MSDLSVRNRPCAIVTGASSGIGARIVHELAERGYDSVVVARRTERLEALKAEVEAAYQGVTIDVLPLDLGVAGAADALYAQVKALGVTPTALVNNAGFGVYGNFTEHDPDRLRLMMQLNMTTLTELTWLYARDMVARGNGYILQVASIGAFQPSPFYASYSATKAYVLYMSEALNWEIKSKGVSVTTLCPGLTDTEFHAVADHEKTGLIAKTMMTSEAVAKIGVNAMFARRAVVTPGVINKLTQLAVGFSPRSIVNAVAGVMMRPPAA